MFKDLLAAQLVLHEGEKLKLYIDTVGKTSIGVGRNLTDRGISKDESRYLLNNDMDMAISECQKFSFWNKLTQPRQLAIADLMFNMGWDKLNTFKNMIRAIQDERWNDAYNELLSSKYAAQVNGRAFQLANMLKDG